MKLTKENIYILVESESKLKKVKDILKNYNEETQLSSYNYKQEEGYNNLVFANDTWIFQYKPIRRQKITLIKLEELLKGLKTNRIQQKRELSTKYRAALSAYLKLHNATLSWLCRRRKQPYPIWNSRINNGLCHKEDVITIAKWINPKVKLIETHGIFALVDQEED